MCCVYRTVHPRLIKALISASAFRPISISDLVAVFTVTRIVTEDRGTLPIHIATTGVLMCGPVTLALTNGNSPIALLARRTILGDPAPKPLVTHFP
jgi:hypothetical protein